jgi:hypothetical protein
MWLSAEFKYNIIRKNESEINRGILKIIEGAVEFKNRNTGTNLYYPTTLWEGM